MALRLRPLWLELSLSSKSSALISKVVVTTSNYATRCRGRLVSSSFILSHKRTLPRRQPDRKQVTRQNGILLSSKVYPKNTGQIALTSFELPFEKSDEAATKNHPMIHTCCSGNIQFRSRTTRSNSLPNPVSKRSRNIARGTPLSLEGAPLTFDEGTIMSGVSTGRDGASLHRCRFPTLLSDFRLFVVEYL